MTVLDTVSPLAHTVRRLSALNEHLDYRVGVPDEPGWYPLGDLVDPYLLVDWHAKLTALEGDRRTAAAYLGGWIAGAAVEAYLLPVLTDARLPLAGIDNVGVRRNVEGWFDAVALSPFPIAVLPGDPAADTAGVEVLADRDTLLDATAAQVAAIAPVLRVVSDVMPVGQVALWGGLADNIGARSLWLARLLDMPREQVWAEMRDLTDRIAVIRWQLRQRPTPFPVVYGGGEEWFQVRSTCCLYYRTVEAPDPDGEGYCATCPAQQRDGHRHGCCAGARRLSRTG